MHASLVLVSNLSLCFRYASRTWVHVLFSALTVASFPAFMWLFNAFNGFSVGGASLFGVWSRLVHCPVFWLTFLLTCVTACSMDLVFLALSRLKPPRRRAVQTTLEYL